MPKPLFLVRSSGLYVRFLVPSDLRAAVGSRFLVRSLYGLRNDAARLAAAQVAVALSNAFKAFRGGLVSSDEFKRGIRTFTIDTVKVGQTTLTGIKVDDDEDAARFNRFVKQLQDEEAELKTRGFPGFLELQKIQEGKKYVRENKKLYIKLNEAAEEHIKDLISSNTDNKTIIESRLSLRILSGITGNIRTRDLTVDSVRDFFDAVRNYPKHATQREEYKTLTVKQVVKLAKANNEPPLAQATLDKHWSRLSVFFNYLRKVEYLDRDPLAGLPKPQSSVKSDGGRPFTAEEIKIVFGPSFEEWAYKWPHRFWGVMIGFYSGARVNEVAQLRPDDIIQVNNIWGFVVTDVVEGNSTKNDNSDRFVPLAQPVLDAGFLSYVEEIKKFGFERLFPNLPNGEGKLSFGRQLSRQFSAYIKDQGITESGMGFHALRHHFITYTDRALTKEGMAPENRDPAIGRITGHYKVPPSILRKIYVDNNGLHVPAFFELETLEGRVNTVSKFVAAMDINYPAYRSRQFHQALVKVAEDQAKMKRHKDARSKLKTTKADAKAKGE